MMTRRHCLSGLGAVLEIGLVLGLVPGPAFGAGGAKGEGGETYVKIPTMTLEFWDDQGIFHMVILDLTIASKDRINLDKNFSDKLKPTLMAMSWEDFAHGDTIGIVKAATRKLIAEIVGDKATFDVLIGKLMLQ